MRKIYPFLLAFSLAACSTSDPVSPAQDSHLHTQAASGGGFVTVVETGDRYSQETIYFSFDGGEEFYPGQPQASSEWDLSFRFAWIRINGGVSGPGGMEMLPLDFENYLALDAAPAGDYFADNDSVLAFDRGQGWYRYVQGTDEWFVSERVNILKSASGKYYKMEIVDFLDEALLPGRLEFRWAEIAPLP